MSLREKEMVGRGSETCLCRRVVNISRCRPGIEYGYVLVF